MWMRSPTTVEGPPGARRAPAWSQRVGAFAAVPGLIRELGADPEAILEAAGLAPDGLADPERRVPYAAIGRLLHEAALATHAPHFGLLAGRAWHLADLGAVGEIVRNCGTMREALDALVNHQGHNSEGGLAFVLARAGVVDLGYAIYQGGAVGAAQLCDAVLAGGVNFLRELYGPGWNPTEVLLSHSAPDDVRHYRAVFRVHPHFDAEYCALRFPESWLDRPIAGADPDLKRRGEQAAESTHVVLVQRVYRTVRVQLLAGQCSGDSVAAGLRMHRRTLNRRLHEEGTTFQQCLDKVRFEVACQLLVESRVSLDDVAAALGYASVSPFMRTFRRWSGTTPGQWRRYAGVPPEEGKGPSRAAGTLRGAETVD
jgi:AraC-like DNA-binding protein